MRKKILAGVVVSALCWSGAAAASIHDVDVHLTSSGAPVPPLAAKRISASIETVGRRVLLDRDDGEVGRNADTYNRMMNDIMDRVLIGYTVENMTLRPGERTEVDVVVRPWGNTIETVSLNLDFGALSPLAENMAKEDVQGAQNLVENVLVGLPEDALDWAGGAVKDVLESELERQIPEFYPHVIITPGKTAKVDVYFLPKLPVVRNVNVKVETENIPRVVFYDTRKHMETRYAGLQGLPVAFIRRHEKDIQEDVSRTVSDQWVVEKYKLRVEPQLTVGENLDIRLKSLTDFYDIQASAYIDMRRNGDKRRGKKNEDTVAKVHIGRKFGSGHELFGEVEFKPSTLKWNLIPGYFYRFSDKTSLGYQFETEDKSHHLWLKQKLAGRWSLRFDWDISNHDEELGINYRLHDYVGLEYIVSEHDQWLRVIGYL